MKKILCLTLAAVCCFVFTGCGLVFNFKSPFNSPKLSDEEVVTAFITAYQQGDYEGIKPFISDDNQLHYIFAALGKENATGMDKVYQEVYEQTRDITFSAAAVEGQEAWGTVTVQIQTRDLSAPIKKAMNDAIINQAENGGDAFSDLPSWLSQGVGNPESEINEELTVHVGNRDGDMVMDTLTDREFFAAVCGNFYDYIDTTMTTCTSENDDIWIAAQGDNVVGMIQSNTEPLSQSISAEEEEAALQAYLDMIPTIDGVKVGAQISNGNITTRVGVNFEVASSTQLTKMGIIGGKTGNTSSGYLSLRSSVKGFQDAGMTCETTGFPGAVQEEADKK